MKHARLFDLRVQHEFTAGARCRDLELRPRDWHPSGERALARHRLIARPLPDGIEVVGPLDREGRPFIALEDALTLGFDVRVREPSLPQYTRLDGWMSAPPLLRGSAVEGGPLQVEPAVHRPPGGVLAGVEIGAITAAWFAAPPTFTLELAAREHRWAYYLLTSRSDAVAPEIVDGEAGRALVFSRELLAADKVSPTSDPVGHRLLAQSPGRRCYRMLSTRAIACRSAPLRQLSLHLGGELLIRELPSPSFHDPTTIKVEPAAAPEQSLYCVIEY